VKKLVKMDGAFPYMDDLSEKEISDRLESLFDSSLPSVSFTNFFEQVAPKIKENHGVSIERELFNQEQ
jgi:hypothetical protein